MSDSQAFEAVFERFPVVGRWRDHRRHIAAVGLAEHLECEGGIGDIARQWAQMGQKSHD